jgi:internalin A
MASDERMSDGEREAERRIENVRREGGRRLDLSELGLKSVPESVRALASVEVLDFSGNELSKLPEWVARVPMLGVLDLHRNPMRELPVSLMEATKLFWLSVSRTRLESLPTWLGELNNLNYLLAEDLGLSSVPECIRQCKKLLLLNLGNNALRAVPEWIGELGQLQQLLLSDNKLISLPSSMKALSTLGWLGVARNPDLGIPEELLLSEARQILNYYFRTRQREAGPLNEAKLILVGRGEVGKTSLVDRLIRGVFEPQKKTEGIQITKWPIRLGTDDVLLHVWDFGGQEIMHATHQFFMTERSLYVIVLDGRLGAEDTDVEYWLKLIESFGGDSPVIIVLNKIQSHPFDLNRRGLMEKYPGRTCDFIRTDCEDATGIDELRTAIFRHTGEMPRLRDLFPAAWFSIKERLSGMEENYLSMDAFRNLCEEHGETDPEAQETLGVALHCLGIALNYKDDTRLRLHQVLNPHWVTTGIYKILNSPKLEREGAELRIEDLGKILDQKAYPPAMHEFLFNLMRRFELCFRFPEPNDDAFLIPQLLGKEQPDLGTEFEPGACLNFQYSYPVLPEGVLPRFIVRTNALSVGQHRWRSGVVLQFEGNRALVKADAQDKVVSIAVNGRVEGRRRLLAVTRSDFDRIHADIRGLKPVASVPVPKYPAVSLAYEDLLVYERKGRSKVDRVVGDDLVEIDVSVLLDSVEVQEESAGRPVRVFVSYSHKDDELRAELDTHLKIFERTKLIESWHDRRIPPGADWKGEIDRELESADLILFLVSSDFLASDYCYDVEGKRALERESKGEARVVPIIVRKCQWKDAPFAKLQVLPTAGKAVRLWGGRDSAWSDVAEGIKKIVAGGRLMGQDRRRER